MGKTIVCWSPVHGQGATTSNTVALASVLALDQPYRTLLTHTQLSYSTMEGMFSKGKKQVFDDGGMVALERLVKSKLLKPDDVPAYTETIYKSRLDFLPGGNVSVETKDIEQVLFTILRAAQQQYDLIWIDAHSGTANKSTSTLLKQADLVIVNLPQNKFIIEQFYNPETFPEELKDKPYIVVISQYDNKASYSLRNLKRQLKVKMPLYEVLYDTGFRDAVNQDAVMEFFYRATKTQKGDALYPFVNSLREINDAVLKKLDFTRAEDEWA
ncbi:hypothetical protein V6B14_22260 (plasmid) [Sporosarcina psychrophila]|uniref:hypothetical protein n=1 Tax=Sporosarcina psychrophila TaxID=1476 RepID=UPI0030CB994A